MSLKAESKNSFPVVYGAYNMLQNKIVNDNAEGKTDAVTAGTASGKMASIFSSKYGQSGKDAVANSTTTYMFNNEEGSLSVKSGLAYSKASLASKRDANGDVKADSFGATGKIVDTNGDGKISDVENLAYAMLQDLTDGNLDGKVTRKNIKDAKTLEQDPEYTKQQLVAIQDQVNQYA